MSRFLIGIVGLGRNPHVPCFLDVAKAMASALRQLGHEVEYASEEARAKGGRYILFGANNLFEASDAGFGEQIPPGTIIFNSEQLAAVEDPAYFLQGYLKFRDSLKVWDYSRANVETMKDKLGIDAVYCPLGYVPTMTTIKNLPPEQQDIDVLFYGSTGDSRRREILDAIEKAGLKLQTLFGVFGEERDAYIARSKVVLNLHYYPHGVFEIFRVSHLLANKKAVVTEAGGCDVLLESLAAHTCEYVPREDIVDTCRTLCALEDMRQLVERRGFEKFSEINFADNVQRALEQS